MIRQLSALFFLIWVMIFIQSFPAFAQRRSVDFVRVSEYSSYERSSEPRSITIEKRNKSTDCLKIWNFNYKNECYYYSFRGSERIDSSEVDLDLFYTKKEASLFIQFFDYHEAKLVPGYSAKFTILTDSLNSIKVSPIESQSFRNEVEYLTYYTMPDVEVQKWVKWMKDDPNDSLNFYIPNFPEIQNFEKEKVSYFSWIQDTVEGKSRTRRLQIDSLFLENKYDKIDSMVLQSNINQNDEKNKTSYVLNEAGDTINRTVYSYFYDSVQQKSNQAYSLLLRGDTVCSLKLNSELINDTAYYFYTIKGVFPQEERFPSRVYGSMNKSRYRENPPRVVLREIKVTKDSTNLILLAEGKALLENGLWYQSKIDNSRNYRQNDFTEICVEHVNPLHVYDDKQNFLYDYPSIISFFPNFNLATFPGHHKVRNDFSFDFTVSSYSDIIYPRTIAPINYSLVNPKSKMSRNQQKMLKQQLKTLKHNANYNSKLNILKRKFRAWSNKSRLYKFRRVHGIPIRSKRIWKVENPKVRTYKHDNRLYEVYFE